MKGVIFDMDGTMFDSERVWREIWWYLARAYGHLDDDTLGHDFCGKSGVTAIPIAEAHFPELPDPKQVLFKGNAIYKERTIAKQPPEKPGLHEIVEGLYAAGFRLAVASGAEQETIDINVKRAGLDKYIKVLVSGYNVPHGKPAPDIFLEAAKEMGLDPKECYVVEDGANGILGAHAAGCTPMLVPDIGDVPEDVKAMCHGVYPSLIEVLEAILQRG